MDGRTWTLGAAAYIFCWAAQLLGVFLLYEIVYSFTRRWRVSTCILSSSTTLY
jgi:hypothetical protein